MSTRLGFDLPMYTDESLETTIEEKYLSLQAVGDILSVSRWTLYRWLKNGELRGTKVGAQYRVSASEVQRILGTQGHGAAE